MSLKLGLFAVLLFVGFETPTEAHDIYSPLRDKAGRNCCDNGDCRPAPYRVRPTGVQMFVEGEWIWVPDHTIRYRALLGETGETDRGIGAGGSGLASRWAMLPSVQSFRRTLQRFRSQRLPFVRVTSGLFHKGASAKYAAS